MGSRLARTALPLAIALGALAPPSAAADRFDATIKSDLHFARAQLVRTLGETPAGAYPEQTRKDGRWLDYCCSWTGGYLPGTLWLMYKATGDERWRTAARHRQADLEPWKDTPTTHDLGLLIGDTFGRGYRLTGNDRFRKVVLTAARTLAKRYSDRVHAIRSWNNRSDEPPSDFRVIVDGMMNIEMLFWASHHGGGPGPASKALAHALTTARTHVRPDGSTFHEVIFDARTGAVRHKQTVQGYSDSSTWSRGQAWAIYGFTAAYGATHDARMLATARRVADYYVAHLPPDRVPFWDFQAPGIPHAPRDSSAAAIAASGLIQLAGLEPDPGRAERYLGVARATLRSLSSSRYLARGTHSRAILLHGTADKPGGHWDRGLIYGDYYFVEALIRYRDLERRTAQERPLPAARPISIQGDR